MTDEMSEQSLRTKICDVFVLETCNALKCCWQIEISI